MAEAPTLRRPPHRARHARGFTYLSLIIVVAIIGLVAASAIKLGSVLQRSRAEQELLDIGAAFSDALKSYADATPQGMPTQPPSLKELLKDPRFPGTRRHLRKIFVDPMTGKAEWGIVYRGDKIGVLAVYSLSDAKPVKIGNFPVRYSGFDGKSHISEWKFTISAEGPSVAVPQQGAPLTEPSLPASDAPVPVVAPTPEKTPEEPVSPSEPAVETTTPAAPPEPATEPENSQLSH
ncbi:type II secretion system protein [Duganella flavida]|uniref:type II secretion system protein n=1 Tax=Duganella flavida TaxID=2692175 RepID=UPI001E5BBF68|nr:type II secretion system protein [Duganella flavida]